MDTDTSFEDGSDDEIFFGPLTLKEIKITLGVIKKRPPRPGKKKLKTSKKNDLDTSIRLIETNSAPDWRSLAADRPISSPQLGPPASDDRPISSPQVGPPVSDDRPISSPQLGPPASDDRPISSPQLGPPASDDSPISSPQLGPPASDDRPISSPQLGPPASDDSPISSPQLGPPASYDSFIQTENMISELCSSLSSLNLDSTLEVIDSILNNGPNKKDSKQDEKSNKIVSPLKIISYNTPVKDIKQTESDIMGSPYYFTPREPLHVFTTPCCSKTPLFETPAYPSAMKKPTTPTRGTPETPLFKTPAYPSAMKKPTTPTRGTPETPLFKTPAYPSAMKKPTTPTRGTPETPLFKTPAYPSAMKKLPRATSIPKLIRVTKHKENMHIPSVAYKSAKTTKVVQIPDQDKLPQSQWAKKMTSSSSIPTVMKNEDRKMNPIKQRLLSNQAHSFANLSCNQAEVSLCTEKTAFKSTNKH